MIGKMFAKGGSGAAKKLIDYCYYEKELKNQEKTKISSNDVRGKLIYIQNLALDLNNDGNFNTDYLANQFEENAKMNKKLNKYLWHQTFSFPIGESPNEDQMAQIAQDFANVFGFKDNQMLVFRHFDTEHAHFHIVANRISIEGRSTASDSYSFLRTGDFCREMELKYGFQIIPNMKKLLKKEEKIQYQSNNQIAEGIREKIDILLPKVNSLEELKSKLKKIKVKMYIGRGVSFTDSNTGAKFKGSDLGRNYSLMNLEKQINNSKPLLNNSEKTHLKNLMEKNFDVNTQSDLIDDVFNNFLINDISELENEPISRGKRTYLTEEEEEKLRKKRRFIR